MMWEGSLVSIYIAPAASEPMQPLAEAHMVPGKGIEGDRYYHQTGYHCDDDSVSYEVTLIEGETIEAIQHEDKAEIDASASRRNLVTSGVALGHLVNKEFRIGDVLLRGIAEREPCSHLAELTNHTIRIGLIHRGGLGAQILTPGVIRIGDRIRQP